MDRLFMNIATGFGLGYAPFAPGTFGTMLALPIYFLLQVLCRPGQGWEARRLILSETSAIGLRCHREERWTLVRCLGLVATELGEVRVKRVETPTGPVLYPEYEDCRRLAAASGRTLKEIYAAVQRCRPEEFQEEKI